MDFSSFTNRPYCTPEPSLKDGPSMDELCESETRGYASLDNNGGEFASAVSHVEEENKNLAIDMSDEEPTAYGKRAIDVCHVVDDDQSTVSALIVPNEYADASTAAQDEEENENLPIDISCQDSNCHEINSNEMSQIVDVGQSMKTPSRVPSECLDVFDLAQVEVDNQNVSVEISHQGFIYNEINSIQIFHLVDDIQSMRTPARVLHGDADASTIAQDDAKNEDLPIEISHEEATYHENNVIDIYDIMSNVESIKIPSSVQNGGANVPRVAQVKAENGDLPIEISDQEATFHERKSIKIGHMVDGDQSIKSPSTLMDVCADPSQVEAENEDLLTEISSQGRVNHGNTSFEMCHVMDDNQYASTTGQVWTEDGDLLVEISSLQKPMYHERNSIDVSHIVDDNHLLNVLNGRVNSPTVAKAETLNEDLPIEMSCQEATYNVRNSVGICQIVDENRPMETLSTVLSRCENGSPVIHSPHKSPVSGGMSCSTVYGRIFTTEGDTGECKSNDSLKFPPSISGRDFEESSHVELVEDAVKLDTDMHAFDAEPSESSLQSTMSQKGKEHPQVHVESIGSLIKKWKRARRRIKEYKLRIQALENEVNEAWMSADHANSQNEKLQNELDCKSFHVDTLAQAVERQLLDLKEVQDKAESEKRKCLATLLDINSKYQILKQDYAIIAKESHEWVNSFPVIRDMSQKVEQLVHDHAELKKTFVKQGQELRLYYNQVLELKGNIRVFCRCRPLNTAEVNAGSSAVVEFDPARDNELTIRTNGSRKQFKFDRVFTPANNQGDVFLDTAPVVVSVLDGYNVCIFAYGQTGTGKTFTMEGTEQDRGVNYRTLEELFNLASQRKGQYNYTISVSVVEIYNEQIRDLLAAPLPIGQTAKKLEIKQVAEGINHVPGLTQAMVQSMDEVWEVLQRGSSARVVSATNCNEHSSRSHCMLCVMVKGESLINGECTRSKLWLVDLAGSERVAKSDVQGERLKEAQSINKSLSALGDVIHALSTKSNHVPYRNSKLTHILQDSLGGDSKTLMFVQISPSELDAGETICSLNFASRVRGVELGPARKQADSIDILKYKQMVESFKQEGKIKDESLRKQEEGMKKLEELVRMKDQASRAFADKVKEYEGTLSNEKKARCIAESKLKEQQILIDKLREELRTRVSTTPAAVIPCVDRRILQPIPLGLNLSKIICKEDNVKASEGIEGSFMGESLHNKNSDIIRGTDSVLIERMKSNSSLCKYNVPSSSSAPLRKPGRVSLCVMPRRPSMSMANTSTPAASRSLRSSSESLQDTFADENQLPNPEKCNVSSPKPYVWKKGASLTPSTVLRRSIPRKVHFKSPHLQPSYMSRPFAAERTVNVVRKGENEGEGKVRNKMRRISIATTWGKQQPPSHQMVNHQPWNSNNTTSAIPLTLPGGARRVIVGSKALSNMYNKEKIWTQ